MRKNKQKLDSGLEAILENVKLSYKHDSFDGEEKEYIDLEVEKFLDYFKK